MLQSYPSTAPVQGKSGHPWRRVAQILPPRPRAPLPHQCPAVLQLALSPVLLAKGVLASAASAALYAVSALIMGEMGPGLGGHHNSTALEGSFGPS